MQQVSNPLCIYGLVSICYFDFRVLPLNQCIVHSHISSALLLTLVKKEEKNTLRMKSYIFTTRNSCTCSRTKHSAVILLMQLLEESYKYFPSLFFAPLQGPTSNCSSSERVMTPDFDRDQLEVPESAAIVSCVCGRCRRHSFPSNWMTSTQWLLTCTGKDGPSIYI